MVIFLGIVHTKSQKIDLLPPCPCGHTINFEKSEVFYTKNCGRPLLSSPLSEKCTHWTNPFPPDYGRLLWTAPYDVMTSYFR